MMKPRIIFIFDSMADRRGISSFFFYLIIVLVPFLVASCASSKKHSAKNRTVEEAIRTARGYTGVPYKWGGTQRSGMDCSGLVMVSYREAGVRLPRTTKDMSKIGKPVKKGSLQPGDLVFFSAKKGRRKITHMGLVTRVKGREITFIHASSSLGVVESDLNSRYYSGIFVKARRPEI